MEVKKVNRKKKKKNSKESKISAVRRKLAKVLTVSCKSHYPIEIIRLVNKRLYKELLAFGANIVGV